MNDRYSWLKKLAFAGALVAVLLVYQAGSSGTRSGTASAKMADRLAGRVFFQVEVEGEATGMFNSCSGIGSGNEVIESKTADAKGGAAVMKVPGRLKWSDVTLSRGLTTDPKFWDWRQKVVDGKMKEARKKCTIRMMDPEGKAAIVWELNNAWPASLIIDAKGGNEPATEELVITHEGVSRKQ
jgi:phage tail-like protein